MYKFKLKKEVKTPSLMEILINETVDKVAFNCTALCYNKETCTSIHKKNNKAPDILIIGRFALFTYFVHVISLSIILSLEYHFIFRATVALCCGI